MIIGFNFMIGLWVFDLFGVKKDRFNIIMVCKYLICFVCRKNKYKIYFFLSF